MKFIWRIAALTSFLSRVFSLIRHAWDGNLYVIFAACSENYLILLPAFSTTTIRLLRCWLRIKELAAVLLQLCWLRRLLVKTMQGLTFLLGYSQKYWSWLFSYSLTYVTWQFISCIWTFLEPVGYFCFLMFGCHVISLTKRNEDRIYKYRYMV